MDNALSLLVAEELNRAGHDEVHVRALGMAAAVDEAIFDRAAQGNRIVVSADMDFGTLLARRKEKTPSVILFPTRQSTRPADYAALLKANLPQLDAALETEASS